MRIWLNGGSIRFKPFVLAAMLFIVMSNKNIFLLTNTYHNVAVLVNNLNSHKFFKPFDQAGKQDSNQQKDKKDFIITRSIQQQARS